MAEENFEDDLFADLYDDNDAPAAPASAPAPAATAAVPAAAPAIEAKQEPASEYAPEDHSYAAAEHGYGGENHDEQHYEDDDDDIDFNLGNGPTNDAAATQFYKEEDSPGPSFHSTRGPSSSKEDG